MVSCSFCFEGGRPRLFVDSDTKPRINPIQESTLGQISYILIQIYSRNDVSYRIHVKFRFFLKINGILRQFVLAHSFTVLILQLGNQKNISLFPPKKYHYLLYIPPNIPISPIFDINILRAALNMSSILPPKYQYLLYFLYFHFEYKNISERYLVTEVYISKV